MSERIKELSDGNTYHVIQQESLRNFRIKLSKIKKHIEILRTRDGPEILRIGYFSGFFQKINSISNSYEELSDDEKLNQLCEVLELTGKVQHEVFSVISSLSEASESDVMKSRLLPWISNGFLG